MARRNIIQAMREPESTKDNPARARDRIGGDDAPGDDEDNGRRYTFPRPEVPGSVLTLHDLYRFDPLAEEGPDIVYEGYVVAHPGTPSERHVLVHRGWFGGFAPVSIDEAIAEGRGTFGYVTKNGVRVSYHRGRSSLRRVG